MYELDVMSEAELNKKLSELEITRVQLQLIRDLGDAIAEVLELPNTTIRGLYFYSVIDWQKQIKLTMAETESKASTLFESRVTQVMEVFAHFRKRSKKLLHRNNKTHLLEAGFQAALTVYIKKYATRPPDEDAPR